MYTNYYLLYSYDYFIRFYNLIVFFPFDVEHKNSLARMLFIEIPVYSLSNSVSLPIIGLIYDYAVPYTLKSNDSLISTVLFLIITSLTGLGKTSCAADEPEDI